MKQQLESLDKIPFEDFLNKSLVIKNDLVNDLIRQLKATKKHDERFKLALFLVDNFKDKRIIPELIKLIKKPELKSHNADLVFACSEYSDTQPYLNFFIDLVINEDFNVAWNAYYTIIGMKGEILKKKSISILNKLNGALGKQDSEKDKIIGSLKLFFEQYV